MEYKFTDWFPMRNFSQDSITGAYTWLENHGYADIVDAIKNDPNMPNKGFRRLALVGLIYKEDLINDFLQTCWTQGTKSLSDRRERMEQLHRWFNNRPILVRWLRARQTSHPAN